MFEDQANLPVLQTCRFFSPETVCGSFRIIFNDKMMKINFVSLIILLFPGLLLINSCKKEGFPVPPASTVPLFSYTVDNDGFAPASVSFTNESIIPEPAGTPSYFWNFGDNLNSTEINPSHTYKKSGVFEVKLVITMSVSLEIKELTKSIIIKSSNASGVPVFFTNGSTVFTGYVNSDKPIFSELPVGPFKDSYDIAFDTLHSKLYISDFDAKSIFQCDPDGKNLIEFKTGLLGPDGLAIDYEGNMLYWDTDDGIQRADLTEIDVSKMEDFVTGQTGDPEGVSVDPVNKKLYWTTYNDAGVWMKNLDGTGEAIAIAGVGGGSTLIADNRLFFDQWVATGDIHLKSSNLDGTGVATITTGITKVVFGLGYEPEGQKVYWGDRSAGKIMRSNLDGSSIETWYQASGSSPRGIVFGKKK
jgi:DNA-binding beta-propeller fold protein YncE